MMVKRIKYTIVFLGVLISGMIKAQDFNYHAAFIYNFTKNMQWPPLKGSGDFVISVVGNSPIIKPLKQMAASKTVGSRKIVVKTVNTAYEVINTSHIVYVSSSSLGEFDAAKSKSVKNNFLLITNKPKYGKKGAAINFVKSGGKLRFELNKAAANDSRIKINNKLASLAIVVG